MAHENINVEELPPEGARIAVDREEEDNNDDNSTMVFISLIFQINKCVKLVHVIYSLIIIAIRLWNPCPLESILSPLL